MWLFLVEAYLFVLVAFTLGAVVGMAGVRLGVRRLAPPPTPRTKQPKPPKESRSSRRSGKDSSEAPAGASKGGDA